MKINGMQRMLGAFLSAAIVTSVSCIVSVAHAQDVAHHYRDDAIVRDLKAGKLTVREAQMLRERSDRATARVETPVAHAVTVQKPHLSRKAVKPSKSGKPVHGGKPGMAKKSGIRRKAPIHHLTGPHAVKLHATKPHAKKNGKTQIKAVHAEPRKTAHHKSVSSKPAKAHAPIVHAVQTGGAGAPPIHRRAVNYIR